MLCYATLFDFTFKRQLNPVSISTLSNNESERKRERVVEASERSRHKRSVKRPLPLFCILFHPPPSSAPLRSPALPSRRLSPVAEQKPSGTVQSPLQLQRVCVREREEEFKSYCLHCIEFASPQRVDLRVYGCFFFVVVEKGPMAVLAYVVP